MNKDINKFSVGVWLVVVLLLTVFTLQYVEREDAPIIRAAHDLSQSYFIVGRCDDGRVFGWGNRSVGALNDPYEVGCFDAGGSKVGDSLTLEGCRAAACR